MRKFKVFLGFFLVIVSLGTCFTTAYILAGIIFNKIIGLKPLAQFLLTSLLGFFMFGIFVNFISFIIKKLNRNEHEGIHSELLQAMSKISQGDFNVFIKEDVHDVHIDLAQGINEMAQKLGSIEKLRQDFISNVSHEIQSPLTSISGFATLLKNDNLSLDKHKHYLNIIETESKRLSKLSDNLLKLSSLENNSMPMTMQEFALDKQLASIILLLEPQWKEKNMKVDIILNKLSVIADQDLLSQVWVNLLHNAIKFTPEKGTICIKLIKDNECAKCIISDNGIGISEEDQLHIFERFFKADKARNRSLGGNGLGLALVKKIVEMHNGSITVESRLGGGTQFIVKLPCLHTV
jgi:two-component system, OmpR family, phosphate regulon sensor histidine kinase PhoR